MKDVEFVGRSYKDLLAMPAEVIDTFGYAIHMAQVGDKHPDAKPLKGYNSDGVYEVVEDDGDAYRVFYAVKIGELVYVLHCFQKKSTKGIETPKAELDVLDTRLKAAKAHAKNLAPAAPNEASVSKTSRRAAGLKKG